MGLGGLISPQAVQVKVSTAHVFHVHQFLSSPIHNENVIKVPVLRIAGAVLLQGVSFTMSDFYKIVVHIFPKLIWQQI